MGQPSVSRKFKRIHTIGDPKLIWKSQFQKHDEGDNRRVEIATKSWSISLPPLGSLPFGSKNENSVWIQADISLLKAVQIVSARRVPAPPTIPAPPRPHLPAEFYLYLYISSVSYKMFSSSTSNLQKTSPGCDITLPIRDFKIQSFYTKSDM